MSDWKNHFITVDDLSSAEFQGVLDLALAIKADPGAYRDRLAGKILGLVFQKSSTRTRVSFEVGMAQLGGQGLFLSSNDLQLGRGETIADTARVLSRYLDGIMARTFAHQDVVDLARYGSVPVINGLTDELHPCQAMADFLTLREAFGDCSGRTIAYVGDGNNVAHSLMLAAPRAGMNVTVASPEGFRVEEKYLEKALAAAAEAGTTVRLTSIPREAVEGASAVYTDVWASMGQEDEAAERVKAFEGFQVDEDLMGAATDDAIFLHCLPAHRGEEVSAAVADGPQSRIFDQAENRLHAQKALLVELLP